MKPETLITRYKNLGYVPKGLELNLEVDSIIEWLYVTHDIYVYPMYFDTDYGKYMKPPITTKHRYLGCAQWDTTKEYTNRFSCDKYFKNPYDAKFDALRYFHKSIKFQKY